MIEKRVPADIKPNYSLRQFAETYLAEPGEWDEYLRVQGAHPPKVNAFWATNEQMPDQQDLVHLEERPSPDFKLLNELHEVLVERLRAELLSGKWTVRAIGRGKLDRETMAPDFAAAVPWISFLKDQIGSFGFVEIEPLNAESRFLRLKWIIEQICAVVPPKEGFGKDQVEELAGRLLPYKVGTDVFKAAWREANIPREFRKSGP